MGAAFGKAAPTSELGCPAMLGAAAGRLAGSNAQAARPFGAHRFYSGAAAAGGATPTSAAASLPAQRTPGSGAAAFAAQSARNSARTGGRWPPPASGAATTQVAAGPGSHLLGSPSAFGRSELDAGAARFGKPNGNSLLRRARSVLALADVVHLLTNKFARLSARGFALALILVGAFQCLLLWHGYPSLKNTMLQE